MDKHPSYLNNALERHIILDINNEDTYSGFIKIGKAISSITRLKILKLLCDCSMNIVEISNILNIPISSAASHINYLEDAGLVVTQSQPGIRGSKRVCSTNAEEVLLLINQFAKSQESVKDVMIDMPIGQFYSCDIKPTCGIVNENGYIDICDNPSAFFSPLRVSAQILWFQQGYIEYRFPNHQLNNHYPSSLTISLELCSEAPGYRNNWPSDITFSINENELLTYTSPGDFGGQRGKLTPKWWPDGNTQYGLLKTIKIDKHGVYLDEQLIDGKVTIGDLNLISNSYVSFKISIKEDAHHVGGINLFGEKFGNYAQNILMNFSFQE